MATEPLATELPIAEPLAAEPLIAVRDLTVRYDVDGGPPVTAVDGLSLEIAPGEALGLLGESGCGKTSLALAILGLLPPGGAIAGGSIRFRGAELVGLGERRLRRLRGAEVSLVFQEPALALHPTRRVGVQVAEVIRAHRRWRARRCRAAAEELLAEVGLAGLGHAYPHQLSGGQRQRVVIAQALSCRPSLVIADEPTAALDATTERQVLDLLRGLRERLGVAFLFISHDPRVLAEVADRVLVMYAGRAAEEGPRKDVLREPLHPYAEALLACMTPAGPGRELRSLPGRAPILREAVPGCRFAPRCRYRMEPCETRDPAATTPRPGRRVRCFRYGPDSEEG